MKNSGLLCILIAFVLLLGAGAAVRLVRRPAPRRPLDVHINGASGYGLRFMLRNTYGRTLHYNDGFRLYRQEDGTWELVHTQTGETNRRLRPQAVRSDAVQWVPVGMGRAPKPPGDYRFARDLYRRSSTAQPYKTLYIEFEVECPEAFFEEIMQAQERADSEIPPPLPGQARWRESYIAFVTAGAPGRRMVQSTDVQVSRTAIAFHYSNRSFRPHRYGQGFELAYYADGHWQPMPFTPTGHLVLPLSVGFSILPSFTHFGTYRVVYKHGELPPGQYMLIRENSPAGQTRVWDVEFMLVEFTVTERTPRYLRPTRRISWWNLMGFVRR